MHICILSIVMERILNKEQGILNVEVWASGYYHLFPEENY